MTKRSRALALSNSLDEQARVLARGDGSLAAKILEIARAHDIPVHRDEALVEVLSAFPNQQLLPAHAQAAVAEILSFLYQVDREAGEGQ